MLRCGRSMTFKVIGIGTNRKTVINFLVNSNIKLIVVGLSRNVSETLRRKFPHFYAILSTDASRKSDRKGCSSANYPVLGYMILVNLTQT